MVEDDVVKEESFVPDNSSSSSSPISSLKSSPSPSSSSSRGFLYSLKSSLKNLFYSSLVVGYSFFMFRAGMVYVDLSSRLAEAYSSSSSVSSSTSPSSLDSLILDSLINDYNKKRSSPNSSLSSSFSSLDSSLFRVYDSPSVPLALDTLDLPLGSYVVEVDKSSQITRVWRRSNYVLVAESKCSTGLVPGNKSRAGDMKTPEGLVSIVSVERSSYWSFNGVVGVYGPYFARLSFGRWNRKGDYFPGSRGSIGLHGTNEPELLGSRASHGCVRLPNDFVRLAVKNRWFSKGVPVYIAPSPGSVVSSNNPSKKLLSNKYHRSH